MKERPNDQLVRVRLQVSRRGAAGDYPVTLPLLLVTALAGLIMLVVGTIVIASFLALVLVVVALVLTAIVQLVYVPRLSRRLGVGPWTMGVLLLAALAALGYFLGRGFAGAALAAVVWIVIFAAPRLLLMSAVRRFDPRRSGV